MEHIFSSCKVSLANGRYTWRHNRVLKELVLAIFSNLETDTDRGIDPVPMFFTAGKKKK